MDIEVKIIINHLNRKARVLIEDGKRMGFPYGKQCGEEMVALLEILENAIERRESNPIPDTKGSGTNGDTV